MFKFLITLLVCGSFVPQILSQDEEVHTIKYTASDFGDEVAKKHHFVMFYAPWCHFCKKLEPTWEQLAEMLNVDDSNIRVAKLDCTTDASICSEQDVTGYPTLKFFKMGQKDGVKFKGTRDLPTLTNFINEQLREEDDEISANIVTSQESPLKELTEENFDLLIEKGKAFIKFYAPWCGHCQRLAPTWLDLAKAMEFNEEITIAKIDCTEYKDICSTHEVKGYPTLLWFENGQKIEKYSGDRSLEDLKNYVNRMAGKKETHEKPEPEEAREAEKDVPVLELTAQTFPEEIQSGITFVEFYSPWCGHCKRLAHTWELLGQKFLKSDQVKIAKVDCTQNDNREFCNEQEIDGFPSLFLYKSGKKISEYSGSRELDDLYEFVNSHVVHDEL